MLRFVGNHIKWNEEYRYTLDGSLDDAFNRKTGSSAELNLAVVALLRRAGLDAVPMLISTRNNGQPYAQYPFRSQFNSVVAYLHKGNSGVVLDATNPYLPVGQVRIQHNNGSGWLVDHATVQQHLVATGDRHPFYRALANEKNEVERHKKFSESLPISLFKLQMLTISASPTQPEATLDYRVETPGYAARSGKRMFVPLTKLAPLRRSVPSDEHRSLDVYRAVSVPAARYNEVRQFYLDIAKVDGGQAVLVKKE